MQIGIVGLPFTGKSTLFQTITKTLLDPNELIKIRSTSGNDKSSGYTIG